MPRDLENRWIKINNAIFYYFGRIQIFNLQKTKL